MAATHAFIAAFNAGEVGGEALGRVDIAKMRYAAETQVNILPSVLGPAQFRPGFAYKATAIGSARDIPFVFDVSTKAILEVSNLAMRVLIDGTFVTRPAVTAAIANGTFGTDLASWTDSDESGATSAWLTGGYMSLLGTGTKEAIREQQVTVNETGVEHALRVIVTRGPVTIRVGSASQTENYIPETSLETGEHSLAFTPSGNFYITLSSASRVVRLVDSIAVESSGAISLTTPWSTSNFPLVRYYQSLNVIFAACNAIIQKKILRWPFNSDLRSWSIVDYAAPDGPFRAPNFGTTTITPSATNGNITLTASRRLFRSTQVGALFRLTHGGQLQSAALAGDDQFTDPIRISGIGDDRTYYFDISGVFVGTITKQRAFGTPDAWLDTSDTYTSPTSNDSNDGLDNQIVYYRFGFKSGNYTSGTATVTLTYPGGVTVGVVRLTAYSSSTSVSAEVIAGLGNTTATADWEEGEWSAYRGFPSAVEYHDGRLWWGWKDRVYGSVSDAYESYDDTIEGDSGPIVRSATRGGADTIYWLLSSQRLIGGTAQQEFSIRSSSFDEPLTPTAFTARPPSTLGGANVQAVSVDGRAVFVHRNGRRVYGLAFSVEAGDYTPLDLSRLKPQMYSSNVVEMTVQRQPDTRIWCVLADGTAAVLTYAPDDEVAAWTQVTTTGLIKSICVLPGDVEDEVWAVVRRTKVVSGTPTIAYYHEKMALQSEARGGIYNKTMDSHIVYTGGSTSTITGLTHLVGMDVVVWGRLAVDSPGGTGSAVIIDTSATTVNGSGQITVPQAVTEAVVGLAYAGQFKSAKLAYGAQGGTAISYPKRVDHLALLMKDVAWKGVRIGRDFSHLMGLTTSYNGTALGASEVVATYDQQAAGFPGRWDADARVCFKISSPYCATFLGMVVSISTNERRVTDDERQD